LHFAGDPGKPRDWQALLQHTARHGRFAFATAALAPRSLTQANTWLDMLPRVAASGLVFAAAPQPWHWRDEHGLLRLETGRAAMPPLLQWRGAIAFETRTWPARRKAA
jgi:hypothetical protein